MRPTELDLKRIERLVSVLEYDATANSMKSILGNTRMSVDEKIAALKPLVLSLPKCTLKWRLGALVDPDDDTSYRS